MRETYETMCHGGVQTVMYQLRGKFWILSKSQTVYYIIL